MYMIKSRPAPTKQESLSATAGSTQGVVIVVSDDPNMIEKLEPVCSFLELRPECVSAGMDLLITLQKQQPIAVISAIETEEQDGFHTMKVVADYHRDLPVFMLTDGDPILMGATDAMQEICGLTSVVNGSRDPLGGQLVPFLFNAGRKAGCMRLVPI